MTDTTTAPSARTAEDAPPPKGARRRYSGRTTAIVATTTVTQVGLRRSSGRGRPIHHTSTAAGSIAIAHGSSIRPSVS